MAQDPVKVDSRHNTVDFENEHVRVLRIRYGPGEKSQMHSHPRGVAVFLTDTRGRFNYPGGKSEDFEVKAGQAVYSEATEHLPENLGKEPLELLQIELKH